MNLLKHKAVAYLNLDIVVTGRNVLQASASPLLHDLLYDSAKEASKTWKKAFLINAKYLFLSDCKIFYYNLL